MGDFHLKFKQVHVLIVDFQSVFILPVPKWDFSGFFGLEGARIIYPKLSLGVFIFSVSLMLSL